jgi:hypothetical protein
MIQERYQIVCEYLQAQLRWISERCPAVGAEIKRRRAQFLNTRV